MLPGTLAGQQKMFISDRLVYLQLEKTGCTHIAKLLADCVEGKQVGKHNRLPSGQKHNGKYIVGSVRNPWCWYLSLWAFGCSTEGRFYNNVTSRHFRRHFRKMPFHVCKALAAIHHEILKPLNKWLMLYSDCDDPGLFRAWCRLALDQNRKYDFGEGYGYSSISSFTGLMTYRYIRLYSRNLSSIFTGKHITHIGELREFDTKNNLLDDIIRNESLEDDLIRVLRKVGYHLSDYQERKVRCAEKTNPSKHESARYYYDSETIELVGEREKFIVEKYSYEPPKLT